MPFAKSVPVRRKAARFLVFGLLLTGAGHAMAAPEAKLWPRWQAHDAGSTQTVDHSAWQAFLGKYVRPRGGKVNLVAYGAVSGADKSALGGYVKSLEAVKVSGLARPEQLAYWLNLYNALTVQVVLAHYPVESIRDIGISPGVFAKGPWGKKLATVEGQQVSLDDIEHRILRPIWRDARIHYGVNCASIGCPDLPPQAFTGKNADALLSEGARAYVNHPRGASLDGGKLTVSSIYVWFKADFGGTDAGVIEHLRRHAAPELKAKLDGVSSIASDRYDWSLNDAK